MHGNRLLTEFDMNIISDRCGDIEEAMSEMSGSAPSWSSITGKPSFHAVATSGSYNDLTNKPSIPDVNPLIGRLDDLEDVTASFSAKFTTGRASSLSAVTVTPVASSVTLLGIQVVTGDSFTALVSAFNTLKSSHNLLIERCKTWGWMTS